MSEIELEIDRDAVELYLRTQEKFFGYIVGIATFGLGIIVVLIYHYKFGRWLCQQQANNLHYRLDDHTLQVDGGLFFLFRKSIPLERITDVTLIQGPLHRYCKIWAVQIHTAGALSSGAGLIGVRDPERVRDLILSRRQSVYGEKSEDA